MPQRGHHSRLVNTIYVEPKHMRGLTVGQLTGTQLARIIDWL